MTSEAVLEKVLSSLGAYYNINNCNDAEFLYARCDYFEHAENFIVSRKANLWSADSEEFMYIFKVSFLTKDIFESSMEYVKSDWEKHAHIGPGHMYTYITPIFICDNAEPMAARLLRKFRSYKSYRFSFWGWSEFHTALVDCSAGKIITNRSGKCVRKSLGRIIHNS